MFFLISCGSDRANSTKGSAVAGVVEVIDSDGDGIPDNVDADVNGDGILDNGTDTDGDGIIDIADSDVNGDGIIDNGPDNDGDGINNEYDNDDDNDGLPDALDPNDNNPDTDGDGILDGADADVDGDGVVDNGIDTDGDGINDNSDADVDGDGVVDNGVDSDGDGISDEHDPVDNSADADHDGLPDALDPNDNNPDTDGDGILDGADADVNGDGVVDNGIDTDGDGINDFHDEDDDNDGVPDALDPDSTNADTDGDGIPDGADADMNGDGILDNGKDTDGDGINDASDADINGDGILDNGIDSDGDGINNEQDYDDDNDGLSDISEEHLGTNPLSDDSDGDGIKDLDEGIFDSDGDGIIDALDSNILDTDNDGVVDQIDRENENPNNDSDGDGQANVKELECGDKGDPLDKTKQCPWATDTKEGKSLLASSFVYVPGGFDVDNDQIDEVGFWISAYQARSEGVFIDQADVISAVGNYRSYIDTNFKILNTQEHTRGYNDELLSDTLKGEHLSLVKSDALTKPRISSLSAYLALVSLNKYQLRDENDKVVQKTFGLLTHKQYLQIMLLLEADLEAGGDGKTLRNGLLGVDINVPKADYGTKIYEFGEENKEYIKELVWLVDRDENIKFILDQVQEWWKIDIDKLNYHHLSSYGASSILDVGMGTGTYKDRYAVVVRGGSIMDLTIGTTGAESDNEYRTNGVGFRAATSY